MRRRRVVLIATVAFAGLAGLRVALWRPASVFGTQPGDGYTRWSGVLHVHTTLSDGGGSPEEVIAAARASGLDFLVITDHNTVEGKKHEGYHQGVLVLVGTEISTNAGHVVGLGVAEPGYRFSGDVRDALDDIRDLGGFPVAAHPFSSVDNLHWTGWDLPGPWGIELLNGDAGWRSAGWRRLLRTVALYPLNRRYALLQSLRPVAFDHWDALLRERDVPGMSGADAHSRIPIRKQWSVRFPSYRSLFDLVRTHVLLGGQKRNDAAVDGAALIEAIRRGRCYVAVDALAPGDGFVFAAEANGRRFTMGDHLAPEPRPRFVLGGAVPKGTRVRLLRDGAVYAEGVQELDASADGPGVYRAEARIPGSDIPWIVTNPIYVFDGVSEAKRAERAAWPEDGPAPVPAVLIDDFEGPATAFAAEFDASSSMRRDVLDPSEAAHGRSSARLSFRLGTPGPGRPYTWCALVNREKRDLTGRRGLTFFVKGDGVYRLWVQVRDENPASADEGTEWWFASIRTSPSWQRVALPFSRLRTLNQNSDGCLDLDRVRGLVFVIDPGAMRPGATGKIWIDELGAY